MLQNQVTAIGVHQDLEQASRLGQIHDFGPHSFLHSSHNPCCLAKDCLGVLQCLGIDFQGAQSLKIRAVVIGQRQPMGSSGHCSFQIKGLGIEAADLGLPVVLEAEEALGALMAMVFRVSRGNRASHGGRIAVAKACAALLFLHDVMEKLACRNDLLHSDLIIGTWEIRKIFVGKKGHFWALLGLLLLLLPGDLSEPSVRLMLTAHRGGAHTTDCIREAPTTASRAREALRLAARETVGVVATHVGKMLGNRKSSEICCDGKKGT